MTHKVSVITGYFNRGDKVERTLQSLKDQTFEDFEIIVFDDASTDDTLSRIEVFANAHPNCTIKIRRHSANKGFVGGMIEAIAETQSEYIAVQGSGDIAHPDRLRHQAAILDVEPNVVAVGCWYHSVTEVSRERQQRRPNADDASLESLIRNGPPFTHGEVMFRRSAYEVAGGYRAPFKFSQDYDLWLRMIQVGKFRTVPIFLYDRFVLRDGASYDPAKRAMQVRYGIIARKLAALPVPEAVAFLSRLELEGPNALVPLEHPELQSSLFQAAIASVAWENVDAAKQIADEFLVHLWRRWALTAVTALTDNVLGRSLLRGLAAIRQRARR